MKKLQVVLGANYGDEGKGRTVNYLAGESKSNCAVVRFNGGAQAGHTVVSSNYRHVFSHFGSGSFYYVPTILTSDFVCSPYLFKKENEQLIRKSVIRPDMYVSPDCPVTTPWDMMVNQLSEIVKGDGRHGSVGVGFGETLERHQTHEIYQLKVSDLLLSKDAFMLKMHVIFSMYTSARLDDIGYSNLSNGGAQWVIDMIEHPLNVHEMFYDECQYFLKRIILLGEKEALNEFEHLIFEGAQGLALDQDSSDFPHVTRSFTGINNVLRVCDTAGIQDNFELFYVTRPYLTRHGAGPLKNEEAQLEDFEIVDETNKPHEFQGTLRFAYHDLNDLATRVKKDISKIDENRIGKIIGVVTCCDQIKTPNNSFRIMINDERHHVSDEQFCQVLGDCINADEMAFCFGELDWAINFMRRD